MLCVARPKLLALEKVMRFHVAAAALGVGRIFVVPAYSQDKPIVGVGVFCETADKVGKFIRTATETDIGEAFRDSSAPTPSCAIAPIADYEREQVASIREGLKSFRIVRATIISVRKDNVWIAA